MICANCGKEIESSSFCIHCGSEQPAGELPVNDNQSESTEHSAEASTVYCTNCGKAIEEVFKFCPFCEAPQALEDNSDGEAQPVKTEQTVAKKSGGVLADHNRAMVAITIAAIAIVLLFFAWFTGGFSWLGPRYAGTEWSCSSNGAVLYLQHDNSTGADWYLAVGPGGTDTGYWSKTLFGVKLQSDYGGSTELTHPLLFITDRLEWHESGQTFVYTKV